MSKLLCKECQEKLFMQAFSKGKCRICGYEFEDITTPTCTVCVKCATKYNLCHSCGIYNGGEDNESMGKD